MLHVLLASILLAQIPGPPPMLPRQNVQASDSGLNVTGSGSVEAQADSVTLLLRINSRANAMSITAAALQPIEDALVRAGVDRNNITLPPYLQGSVRVNNAIISATVQHPTSDMVRNGIAQLGDAFGANADLLLNSVEVRAKADNCEALTRQAQGMALREARTNADYLAAQLHVHVGAVQYVQANGSVDPTYGCTNTYAIGSFGPAFPVSDPQKYLTVRVFSSVTVRYAIR
jgi:uncharacterized protein YggE